MDIQATPAIQAAQKYTQLFSISKYDLHRPWGAFWYIDPHHAAIFVDTYFSHCHCDIEGNISPKILAILPHMRISWQYHNRRKELWYVLEGPVGVVTSQTNEETPMVIYQKGDYITIDVQERHRLVGLDNVAIIAELWCHTDNNYHSDEDDIVRLQDDFKR